MGKSRETSGGKGNRSPWFLTLKVASMRWLKESELEILGYDESVMAIGLEDGTLIFADPEYPGLLMAWPPRSDRPVRL